MPKKGRELKQMDRPYKYGTQTIEFSNKRMTKKFISKSVLLHATLNNVHSKTKQRREPAKGEVSLSNWTRRTEHEKWSTYAES